MPPFSSGSPNFTNLHDHLIRPLLQDQLYFVFIVLVMNMHDTFDKGHLANFIQKDLDGVYRMENY